MNMDRKEAINVLRKIQDQIPELMPDMMSVTDTQVNSEGTYGCIICLKGLGNEERWRIKEIAKFSCLLSEESGCNLTIYSSPKNKRCKI
jgi:hypothetical protein